MKREEILKEAKKCVCSDRNRKYGEPEDSFALISSLWSRYLKVNISSTDVAIMMILLKVARGSLNPSHVDSFIDIAGYAACAGEIAERNE